MLRQKKKTNYFLPLLVSFILWDVICDNYLVQFTNTTSKLYQLFLLLILLLAQIICSPLQAGFSDFYCRKKSLITSLFFSFFSLTLIALFKNTNIFLPLMFLIVLTKGSLGNTIPISWAAIADTQERDFRFSLALSTASYALGYLLIAIFNVYFSKIESIYITIAIYVALIFICSILFKDLKDIKSKEHYIKIKQDPTCWDLFKIEIKLLISEIKEKKIRLGLFAYLLWATSLYCILLLLVDFKNQYPNTAAIMMIGYLIGVIIMKFCKHLSDKFMIRLGFGISVVSLTLVVIMYFISKDFHYTLSSGYFFYSMANAFLSPTILCSLSKEKQAHQQGKTFGFVESADTIGFLAGTLAILVFNFLKLTLITMILFSLIIFSISWIPYAKYEKEIKR